MTAPDDELVREISAGVESLGEGLVALEGDPDRETVDELFRVAHSLKGTCSMADLERGTALAHALEDVLDAVRSGKLHPSEAVVDDALATVDDIETVAEAAADDRTAAVDVDERIATLEERLERADGRDEAAASPEQTADEPGPDGGPEPTDRSDLTPEEALALASEYDDLDSLVADMDDEAEEFDGLEGGGTFDDLLADRERNERSSGSEGNADDSAFGFDQVKSEVETDDIDQLERDLAEVEFGEFDDDDDMTIDELLELDPASSDPVVQAQGGGDDASVAQSSDAGESERASPDLRETGPVEAPGRTPDSKAAESEGIRSDDSQTVESEVGRSDDSQTVESGATGDTPVEGTAADTSTEFEFTSTEDLAGREAATASGVSDGPEAETGLDEPTPSVGEETDVDADAAVGDSTAQADGRDSAEGEASATADGPTEQTADDAPVDAAAAGEAPPDLPDLDDLLETDSDESVDVTAEVDVSPADANSDGPSLEFGREEGLDEFEARFRDVFDEGGDEEETPTPPATTIEASAAAVEQFPRAMADPAGEDDVDAVGAVQSVSVDVETADRLLNLVEELSMARYRLEDALEERPEPLEEALGDVTRVSREFRQTVMDVRLLPLERATNGLSRVVRDVARSEDKEVSFETTGTDVRLDREVIDRIGAPLVHLVRNAVSHGIEPPSEREAAGKPREGTVSLEADRDGEHVTIRVSDDGGGVDRDVVVDRAVEHGLVDAETATDLTRAEVHELLFDPGFSTREEVSETSGRGVGLDVVERAVADLDGSIDVESTPGEGTTVRLSLPVSVAVTELLFVRSGSEVYAVPAAVVEEVTHAEAAEQLEGGHVRRRTVAADGDVESSPGDEVAPRPAVSLAEAFETDGRPDDESSVVWIGGDRRLALRCESVSSARESLVKPYEGLLGGVSGVSGAALRGDGDLVNVIDVETI